MRHATASNGRVYWITWGVLLLLTVVMLTADGAALSKAGLLTLMLGAMSVKAVLIAANFMHLRHEHAGLVLTVVVGLFALALILYGLIAPDALRIHEMVGTR